MSEERDTWSAEGPPWYYGRLICDLKDCNDREHPAYWWRAFGGTDSNLPYLMVCEEAFREFTGADVGLPVEEFIPGAIIAPGHWRPA